MLSWLAIAYSKYVSKNICRVILLQPKQSQECMIMSHRLNKIILSLVYSGNVPV